MEQYQTRNDWFRLIFLLLLFVLPVQADVYKWTDDKGRVHYGDKPVTNSKQIDISEQKNTRNNLSKAEREERRQRLLETFAVDRAEKKERQKKQDAQNKKINRQCANARDQLKNYNRSSRLYDLNDKGERVIFSDKERQQAIDQLSANIKKYCN